MSTLDNRHDSDREAGPAQYSPRSQARARLQARRDFGSHVVSYLIINAFLVATWAFTGAGYFWPGWVLGGWGAAVALHAWDAFIRRPITDADIDAEMRRLHG